jgi:hypothetical protein
MILGAGLALSACAALGLLGLFLLNSLVVRAPAGDGAQAGLPTPACPAPSLALDGRVFSLQEAGLAPEGTLPAAPQAADAAFRVAGAGERRIFLLGPAAFAGDEAALGALAQAIYTAEGCNVTTYQLAGPQPLQVGGASAAGLPQAEALVLVQTGADGGGFALFGTLTGEAVNPASLPTPAASQVQAEIGLLSAQPSAVGGLIQVKLSVYNFGAQPLTVTAGDLSLAGAAPVRAEPGLPAAIQPGATAELELIFPLPAEGYGTLRVFSTEFALVDYIE